MKYSFIRTISATTLQNGCSLGWEQVVLQISLLIKNPFRTIQFRRWPSMRDKRCCAVWRRWGECACAPLEVEHKVVQPVRHVDDVSCFGSGKLLNGPILSYGNQLEIAALCYSCTVLLITQEVAE
eukprot:6197737-Pleurochrysis_carterae.AAC.6